MKYRYWIWIIIGIILFFIVYYYNDGWLAYNIQKKKLTQLELIKYYTPISFSDETKVEYLKLDRDAQKNDEYLEGILWVPANKIEEFFPENFRDYERNFIPIHFQENDNEKVRFSAFIAQAVKKWSTKTQRSIHFAVLETESKAEYTKVYVSIDKLGWWLSEKRQLGDFINI